MNCGWMPSIDVSLIGPKSCHLKLESIFQHDDHSKMRTDRIRSLEKFLYHFGARVGGDVVVFWGQTAYHVAHATTGEIRDVTILAQTRSDFARSFFHRRGFHRTRGRGGSPEPPALRALTITERAIEVNRPCLPIARRRAVLSRTNE